MIAKVFKVQLFVFQTVSVSKSFLHRCDKMHCPTRHTHAHSCLGFRALYVLMNVACGRTVARSKRKKRKGRYLSLEQARAEHAQVFEEGYIPCTKR